MSYFAYILKSDYDGTYYYGSTKYLKERVKVHNSGKSRYTIKEEDLGNYIILKSLIPEMKLQSRKRSLKALMDIIFLKRKILYRYREVLP